MEFSEIKNKALYIRLKYSELEKSKYSREWSNEEIAMGLVGDIGDLMKYIMTMEGVRDKDNAQNKLKHELCDVLWSVIILADKYNVDLENEFLNTMNELDERIENF